MTLKHHLMIARAPERARPRTAANAMTDFDDASVHWALPFPTQQTMNGNG
jgi:hypothetical protein